MAQICSLLLYFVTFFSLLSVPGHALVLGGCHEGGEHECRAVVANGLTFDCQTRVGGDLTQGNVFLLHGFAEWAASYTEMIDDLSEAGFKTVACNQRGYSVNASPDQESAYLTSHLVDDVYALADTLDMPQFHLVGHGLGATLGWSVVADPRATRVTSFSALGAPHNDAFSEALLNDQDQAMASQHFEIYTRNNSAELSSSAGQTLFQLEQSFSPVSESTGMFGTSNDFQKALWWFNGMFKEGRLAFPAIFTAASIGCELGYANLRGLFEANGLASALPQTTKLGEVHVPVLYVCGSKDPHVLCNNERIQESQKYCKASFQKLVTSCGHSLLSCDSPAASRQVRQAVVTRVTGARVLALGYSVQQKHVSCDLLDFPFSDAYPLSAVLMEEEITPLYTPPSCQPEQQCLFLDNSGLANARLAFDRYFPTFENRLSSLTAKSAHVYGVGVYHGPTDIANYLAIPHSTVSNLGFQGVTRVLSLTARTAANIIDSVEQRSEQWYHSGAEASTVVRRHHGYYPCNLMKQSLSFRFPEFTAIQLSGAARQPSVIPDMCARIMNNCVGNNKQFDNATQCEVFMTSLPHNDPTCVVKHGPYAFQGESLMCKFVHQFMTPEQPELHCFHAGPGDRPDALGRFKCVPQDCADEPSADSSKLEPCTDSEFDELETATVYALQFCLPSLAGGSCSASNCTQALNTYLGRFVANGGVCRCAGHTSKSRMLRDLDLDAGLLLQSCAEDSLLATLSTCANLQMDDQMSDCSSQPKAYASKSGCRPWNWDAVESSLLDDWSEGNRFGGRVTVSDNVATAECNVFGRLLAGHRNLPHPLLISFQGYLVSRFGKHERIFVHPESGGFVGDYASVLSVMNKTQHRSKHVGVSFEFCNRGPWGPANEAIATPGLHTTESPEHARARALLSLLHPGLSNQSFVRHAITLTPRPADVNKERDVSKYMIEVIARAAYNTDTKVSPRWVSAMIKTILDFGVGWFFSDGFQRAHGYVFGLGYLKSRRELEREMRQLWDEASMTAIIQAAGLADEVDTETGYRIAATSAALVALEFTASDMLRFIRRDPCGLLPLWYKSPTRFVLEYTRRFRGASGFIASTSLGGEPQSFSIAAAHQDPSEFPDPLLFQPDRDLSSLLTFNALEREAVTGTGNTLKRMCIARAFTVRVLVETLPELFDEVTCSAGADEPGVRVFHGIRYRAEIIPLKLSDGTTTTLEVNKMVHGGKPRDILLATHGFLDNPQLFSYLMSQTQARGSSFENFDSFSLWSTALPGWGRSERMQQCHLSRAGEIIAAIAKVAIAEGQNVYLMGHGLGGLVAWQAAQFLTRDNVKLAGLIVLGAAHPVTQFARLPLLPVSSLRFRPFLSPLSDYYFGRNNFEVFRDLMANESWWDPEWEREYTLHWERTGVKALSCYYRDNFDVQGGRARLLEWDMVRSIDPDTHVMLAAGQSDPFVSLDQLKHSIGLLSEKPGKLLRVHQVKGAGHHDILNNPSSVKDMAEAVERFILATRRVNLSPTWGHFQTPVPSVSGTGSLDRNSRFTVVVVVTGVILGMIAGFAAEVVLAQYIRHHVSLAHAMQAPICMATLLSGDWAWLVLFSIATFKFGLSDISINLQAPWDKSMGKDRFDRILLCAEALADMVHHAAGILVFSSFAAGLIARANLIPAAPLALIHVLSIHCSVKSRFFEQLWRVRLYKLFIGVGVLILEVWFQLEAYWLILEAQSAIVVACYGLIATHYCWVLIEILRFFNYLRRQKAESRVMTNANKSSKVLPAAGLPATVDATWINPVFVDDKQV